MTINIVLLNIPGSFQRSEPGIFAFRESRSVPSIVLYLYASCGAVPRVIVSKSRQSARACFTAVGKALPTRHPELVEGSLNEQRTLTLPLSVKRTPTVMKQVRIACF